MIVSIGTDIIEVYRIRQTLERTPRFAERVFTLNEQSYCLSKGVTAAQSFAGRFAAKEAFLKALGTGWSGKIAWKDVEIKHHENGAPYLEISGEAKEILRDLGVNKIHLSLSHTAEHATASVILEKI